MVRTTINLVTAPSPGTAPASLPGIETPEQRIAALSAKVDALQAELDIQKGLVAALLKRLYGAKSEKMSHDQLLMEFLRDEAKKPEAAAGTDVPPAADEDPAAPARTRARRTNKLSDSLKRLPTVVREVIHPAVLAAPDNYRLIGEEISERLHVSPAAFTLEIIKRLTHVLKRDPDAVPVTPPLEPCLLPGSVLTPSLGAYLLTQKFCYHSPFYREEWKLTAAHGIELTRNLMCSWHDHLADRLRPLYDLIAASFRTATYVKVDETPIRCLEPGKGKTVLGQFWVYHHAEHGVLFDWHKSRANTCLDDILIGKDGEPSFSGYLQSDGLRAYHAFIKRHPELNITAVSCLAHIRRKFHAARDDHPRITAWILNQIACIYRIEAGLREERAGPMERQKARWLETRRHYERLTRLIAHLRKQRWITPTSPPGRSPRLCGRPVAGLGAVLPRRSDRVRQQPHRERHPPDQARHEKLDVHRPRRDRLAQCGDLHLRRAGPPSRQKPLRLLRVGLRQAHAQPGGRRASKPPARGVVESPGSAGHSRR